MSTATRRRNSPPQEGIRVKGMVRLMTTNIRTGEQTLTPWIPNTITAEGFQNYIIGCFGAIAGSKTVGWLQLATQTNAVNSSQTAASGEFESRKSTANTFAANGTFQATCSFATNEATESTLGAMALYNVSAAGSTMCAATFATSNKTTDQTLSCSYRVTFS